MPRTLRVGHLVHESRWEYGGASSGTAGTISIGDISPSIQNSSEYSILQSLFTEVKLISCVVSFVGQTQGSTIRQGSILIGTNMLQNGTTFTTPTSINDVANLDRKREVSTFLTRPLRYRMVVPRGLEFSGITNDMPTVPLPYAGSPGVVKVWGDNLDTSTGYFIIHVTARWMLRGRQ